MPPGRSQPVSPAQTMSNILSGQRERQPLNAVAVEVRAVVGHLRDLPARLPIRPWHLRYALAVVAVALAWAARERVLPEAAERSPFLVFGLAVLVAALAGGFGPGLLAVLLSSVVAIYFYLPPQLALEVHEPFDGVQLGLFVLEGLVAATAGGFVRRALRRDDAADRSARRLEAFLRRAEILRGQTLADREGPTVNLTDREREVARLLAFGLDNHRIAATLFVSRNTVKTHLKHIYEKLAVGSRTEAVARCIELGLLAGGPGEDENRAALGRIVADGDRPPEAPAA